MDLTYEILDNSIESENYLNRASNIHDQKMLRIMQAANIRRLNELQKFDSIEELISFAQSEKKLVVILGPQELKTCQIADACASFIDWDHHRKMVTRTDMTNFVDSLDISLKYKLNAIISHSYHIQQSEDWLRYYMTNLMLNTNVIVCIVTDGNYFRRINDNNTKVEITRSSSELLFVGELLKLQESFNLILPRIVILEGYAEQLLESHSNN